MTSEQIADRIFEEKVQRKVDIAMAIKRRGGIIETNVGSILVCGSTQVLKAKLQKKTWEAKYGV